jgi:3-deoxy-D-manno-octulosonic-acid transferase
MTMLWPTEMKWQAFRTLERLADLRGNETAAQLEFAPSAAPQQALWVFVSTIGELNAVDPFLRALVARVAHLKLVLITDHPHYRPSYEARYRQAAVCVTRGHGGDARRLAAHYPPAMLVVAEIPCRLSDAPCRFSFSFVREAKRRGATALVVNGWLYGYEPSCRMDSVERSLFDRDYLQAFDLICTQNSQVQQALVRRGAHAERVTVTGNIKFDAMAGSEWQVAQARSPGILHALMAAARPVIVAGCVTDETEQRMVLDAYTALRAAHPDVLLILAPRHPEVAERMTALRTLLAEYGLPAAFRSTLEDAPLPGGLACLVLDTMGDLRDFYAACTVAHVGVDHNVLEPLGFGKPVTVTSGWNATYPSYPVYHLLQAHEALAEAHDAAQLGAHWRASFADPAASRQRLAQIQSALRQARGALDRHLAAIERLVQPSGAPALLRQEAR